LRLAILTTSYPRHTHDPSGHFVETEAAHWAGLGHEVHVVAPGPRRSTHGGKARGLQVWRVGAERLFGFPGALPRLRENPFRVAELAWFLPSMRLRLAALGPIDRVIAHFLLPCGYPLALGTAAAIEVVLHGSDARLALRMPRAMRRHMMRALLSAGASFRFVSEDLRARFLAGLDPPERRAVERVSRIELPHVAVPPRSAPSPRGARERWVVCGRLIAGKRVDRAIRMAAAREVHLTVVGDGPLGGELRQLAASLGGAVEFVGQLPRDQALAHIAGADRLVHLSETEGCPTVVREARALGIPVLATAVGDLVKWAAADPGIEIHAE